MLYLQRKRRRMNARLLFAVLTPATPCTPCVTSAVLCTLSWFVPPAYRDTQSWGWWAWAHESQGSMHICTAPPDTRAALEQGALCRGRWDTVLAERSRASCPGLPFHHRETDNPDSWVPAPRSNFTGLECDAGQGGSELPRDYSSGQGRWDPLGEGGCS